MLSDEGIYIVIQKEPESRLACTKWIEWALLG